MKELVFRVTLFTGDKRPGTELFYLRIGWKVFSLYIKGLTKKTKVWDN